MKPQPNPKTLTIGKLARTAGVGVETVRFYERKGLIAKPPQRASGYRQYPAATIRRLRFIRRAKELGFTLAEIGELLSLRVHPETTCSAVRAKAEAKIANIEEKVRTLERMLEALARMTVACSESGPTSACPILEALDQGDDDENR